MPSPAYKRHLKKYGPVAAAISRLEVPQVTREQIAHDIRAAFDEVGDPDFRSHADTFELVASDPLVACAGYGDNPCPEGREIRIAMHLSEAPDGRAKSWRATKPTGIRCVSCGSREFVGAR